MGITPRIRRPAEPIHRAAAVAAPEGFPTSQSLFCTGIEPAVELLSAIFVLLWNRSRRVIGNAAIHALQVNVTRRDGMSLKFPARTILLRPRDPFAPCNR